MGRKNRYKNLVVASGDVTVRIPNVNSILFLSAMGNLCWISTQTARKEWDDEEDVD